MNTRILLSCWISFLYHGEAINADSSFTKVGSNWAYYSWTTTTIQNHQFVPITISSQSLLNKQRICEKSINYTVDTSSIIIIDDSCGPGGDQFEIRIHYLSEIRVLQIYLLNITENNEYRIFNQKELLIFIETKNNTTTRRSSCAKECQSSYRYSGRYRKTKTGKTCRNNGLEEAHCKSSIWFRANCYYDDTNWGVCPVPLCNESFNKYPNCLSTLTAESSALDLTIRFENLSPVKQSASNFIYAMRVRHSHTRQCLHSHYRVPPPMNHDDLVNITEMFTDAFTQCAHQNVTVYDDNRSPSVFTHRIDKMSTSGLYDILMFVLSSSMEIPIPLFSMTTEAVVYPRRNEMMSRIETTPTVTTIDSTLSTSETVQDDSVDGSEELPKKSSSFAITVAIILFLMILLGVFLLALYVFKMRQRKADHGEPGGVEMRQSGYGRSRGNSLWYTTARKCSEISDLIFDSKRNLLEEEFDRMEEEDRRYKIKNQIYSKVAISPANVSKNRYKNILPYDSSRVILSDLNVLEETTEVLSKSECNTEPLIKNESDYINASYILNKNFIAAQAPKRENLADFWSMIWQEDVRMIIILTNVIEKNINKCETYWPVKVGEMVKFSRLNYDICVTLLDEIVHDGFVVREMECSLERMDELVSHKITQLHYRDWPDHGVPNVIDFSNFLTFCYNYNQIMKRKQSAMLVHCSAGVGRTGTFISCWRYYNKLIKLTDQSQRRNVTLDIYRDVLKMRRGRQNMVQTATQYRFIYIYVNYLTNSESESTETSQYK